MLFSGGLFQNIKNKKLEGRDVCDKTDSFISSVEQNISVENEFVNVSYSGDVKSQCGSLISEIDGLGRFSLFLIPTLKSKRALLLDLTENIAGKILMHNDEVASSLAIKAQRLIGDVEGRTLDTQQLKCIVKPSPNHLVIAGAGTGKTTTVVGKVKYLLKSGACKPEDILVLSFTNASASEMKERINKETGSEIKACTFHKLGLGIIETTEGKAPKITQISIGRFVHEKLQENMRDPLYLDLLCDYYIFNHRYNRSEFDFRNEAEYEEYLRTNPPVTLNGDKVKSYGEMDIANFLYRNGIAYEYEKEYDADTRTKDRYQYYPDFYLTDYGYYIEYFGINEKGEVPSYFTSKRGKSPSEEYQEGMEWKRELHKEKGTVLIESYSYERSQGVLLSSLEHKLKELGVEFKPLSSKEIWDQVSESNTGQDLSGIAELMSTVINLMKSNEYELTDLRALCCNNPNIGKRAALVDLIAPIYDAYASALQRNGEIDFNDMINKAAHMIREGKYVNPYKYVIVDEHQDISRSRYNLLKALRESKDYFLFCVGDDWQSIYRFTGSDLGYILQFSDYWGETEYSKIETTYRFTDSLIEISGDFIMQNPSQIKKSLRGMHRESGFSLGEIKGYTEKVSVRFMLERLDDLPKGSSVFFIGRYNFDRDLLVNSEGLECRYDNAAKIMEVKYFKRPDLKMQFMTAHSSKGLQADYVFIINNKDRGMGFPSKIQDDPIIEVLLQGKESFPFAEERRLFYVAMTRAKVKAFLIVVDGNESSFVSEMEAKYGEQFRRERFTCPECGGYLVKKKGPYGEFYGCSNYRTTGCKYTRNIKMLNREEV